jgi:hypothetical protein
MDTTQFKVSAGNSCVALKTPPDRKTKKSVLASAKKKPQQNCTIIIARYDWLKKRKLTLPDTMELPNLCLWIKDGKLERAFYSSTLTYVIKKQRYLIQVLN